MDEGDLIAGTLRGDSEAFGQLVRRYQDRLYTNMVHILGNEEDARDVVQDAFVQALTHLAGFQQASSFYTWLYRIAFNVAMNRKNRERTEQQALQQRTTPSSGTSAVSADSEILRRERIHQVHLALAELDEPFRAVLVLRELEQLDYATIAEILQIEVGTVRSRLHRARILMRETLDRLHIDD